MGIRLPKWEELTRDEQVPIVNLPLDGNYVVVGGPGTGKTILALYRAARWKREKKTEPISILFLVYNNPLMQYLSDAIDTMELDGAYVHTYHQWVWRFYRNATGASAPTTAPYRYDWDEIKKKLEEILKTKRIDYLILDEAQDFPPPLLDILSKLTKSATVFGDSQQALENAQSTTQDFSSYFNASRRVYFLNRNYRNTKEISDVAHLFYTGDKNDIPANPRRNGPKPRFVKLRNQDEQYQIISNYANNNPGMTIGIFLPNDSGVTKKILSLGNVLKQKTKQKVQTYLNKSDLGSGHFSFDDDGIKILSYGTMKGLEFDAVFLPDVDTEYFNEENDMKQKSIYVASTRAKDTLVYMYSKDTDSFVVKKLKENQSLLEYSDAGANARIPF